MKNTVIRIGPSILLFLFFFSSFRNDDLFADTLRDEFVRAINAIEKIAYNPRPIATDTQHVTGVSEGDVRGQFLSTFTRVDDIRAPANGKTFQTLSNDNHPDITLVGYLAQQPGSGANNPWIVVTHGGAGQGSIARERGFIVHIANVLFSNGYNVLAVDRRDGLLSRCAYQEGSLTPDPKRSQPAMVGRPRDEFCDDLPNAFRVLGYQPNSLVTDRTAFNDLLAAAKYLRERKGATTIGVLGGSHGGLAAIRAAAAQGKPGTDFPGDLVHAILALSPVADQNTIQFDDPKDFFECDRARSARFYSLNVNDTGIRNFDSDRVGAVEDFLSFTNGVKVLDDVRTPALIIWTLADETDTARSALAYKAKTDRMKLADTLIMARLGHASEMWQSDPFWLDNVVLVYFKRLLAKNNANIGADPGYSFPTFYTNLDNPYLIKLNIRPEDADKFLSKDSIAPYQIEACF